MKKWLVLLFGICCISVSAILVRVSGVNGIVSAFYRIVFALIIVAPIWISRRIRVDPRYALLCISGGLFFGLELACWNLSIGLLNATVPTILVNLSVLWVTIGSVIFYREKSAPTHWAGMMTSVLGVCVLVGPGSILALEVDAGLALAFSASVFLAIYTLVIRRARIKLDTITTLFFSLIGSLLPLAILLLAEKQPLRGFPCASWMSLIGLGAITQVGGYFSINYVLKYVSPVRVSLLTLLQPIITGILSMIILHERMKENVLIGSAVILSGLAVSFMKAGNKGRTGARIP